MTPTDSPRCTNSGPPPDQPRSPLAGVMALGLALLVVLAAFAGCSPVTRYRVLSFFFDEVPPPAELSEEEKAKRPRMVEGPFGVKLPEQQAEANGMVAPAPAARPEREPAQPVIFHQPYGRRQCDACHDVDAGYQVPTDVASLCGQCHRAHTEYPVDDRVHGPVALGRCGICHEPHKASQDDLLTKAPGELCLMCHRAERVLAQPYHERAEERDCSFCHDPHGAGNRLLLADSGTYERGNSELLPAPSGHARWSQEQCEACHLPEKSNALIDDVEAVCTTCHDTNGLAPPDGQLHAPVAQNLCTLCHTAHRSPRPHLVRPEGEKLCTGCHSIESIRTPEHPEVMRVNCVLCHRGHHSERPHLLKPGIRLND